MQFSKRRKFIKWLKESQFYPDKIVVGLIVGWSYKRLEKGLEIKLNYVKRVTG